MKSNCRNCEHEFEQHKYERIFFNIPWFKKIRCDSIFPPNFNERPLDKQLKYMKDVSPWVSRCGCDTYIPKDNLEYLEWKLDGKL